MSAHRRGAYALGAAYRVSGSSAPVQFAKYNIPHQHHKVAVHGIVATAAAATARKYDKAMSGRGLFHWRRGMVRNMGTKRPNRENKKWLYNTEHFQFMRARMHELLNHRTLVLAEEQSVLADMHGHKAVAELLRQGSQHQRQTQARTPIDYWQDQDVKQRAQAALPYRHRIERDDPVSYVSPRGQHAYKLTSVAGQQHATQLDDDSAK
eukprot:TRINITY_DN12916_c0_g2_i1.p1 TRINITY_DN12916_c0_g2~~TRINITY_DN12916_c0_g2_i1.p1  ORF type:complete len:226 (+),score=83.00 TRINITY_DN12916_c0_g2_i1:56-679(+)